MLKKWNSLRLQTKMSVSFSLLLILIIVISGWFYYEQNVKQLKKQTLTLMNANVSQMSRTVNLYIEDLDRYSISIFTDPVVQSVLRMDPDESDPLAPNRIRSQLLNLSIAWSVVRGIYIYSLDGKVYDISRASSGFEISLEDEPWYDFIHTYTNRGFFLWPTADEQSLTSSKEKVFALVRPIYDIPTSKKLGYLKISIDINVMKKLLVFEKMKLIDSTINPQFYIVDEEKNIIYDSREINTGHTISDLPPSILEREEASGEWEHSEVTYLFASQQSNETGWTTIVMIPKDSIQYLSKNSQYGILGLISGSVALVILISFFISLEVTRPLRKLIRMMQHVERGNFAERIPLEETSSETGKLGRVFNKMMDSLDFLIKQVYEAQLRTKDAQLLALQTQINPHFLYNTLNMMKAMANKHRVPEVGRTAEALADMFRYSLTDWSQPVLLEMELMNVRHLLHIQQTRFGQRFSFEIDVADDLQSVPILKLLVQPLVENAIVHGVEHLRSGGMISLVGLRVESELKLSVTDNGKGLSSTELHELRQRLNQDKIYGLEGKPSGIGLSNLVRRLSLYYGDGARLDIRSTPYKETCFTLTLPIEQLMIKDEIKK